MFSMKQHTGVSAENGKEKGLEETLTAAERTDQRQASRAATRDHNLLSGTPPHGSVIFSKTRSWEEHDWLDFELKGCPFGAGVQGETEGKAEGQGSERMTSESRR